MKGKLEGCVGWCAQQECNTYITTKGRRCARATWLLHIQVYAPFPCPHPFSLEVKLKSLPSQPDGDLVRVVPEEQIKVEVLPPPRSNRVLASLLSVHCAP